MSNQHRSSLSPRETQVLEYIQSYQSIHGGYPTYREIQAQLGLSSINSVSQYIKQLARKEYVDIIKNKGYRLKVESRPGMVSLPFLGDVQAGGPNDTQEIAETMLLPTEFVADHQSSFLLRVRGNSMSEAGIHEDDILIVDRKKPHGIGDIVVALVAGECTVKRLAQKNGQRFLKAENPEYKDIYPEGHWEIQGVVSGLWRDYLA